MPFPNDPEKYGHPAVLDPHHRLALRRQSGRLPRITPPVGLVLYPGRRLPWWLRWRVPVRRAGRFGGDLYIVRATRGRVGVLCGFGIGAPALTALAEELVAWGVRRFVLLSQGGALQPNLSSGDICVIDNALRAEGVSHHYLPPEKFAPADAVITRRLQANLLAQGISPLVGPTWTTDAPYRETRKEVEQYQSEGILTVEMEAAGLFSLGLTRGVQTGALVIAADKLCGPAWEAPTDLRAVERSFEMAYRAAIMSLEADV